MDTEKPIDSQSKLYRYLALLYLGNKCVKCEVTTKLVIHHKDHNPQNNNLSNLEIQCQKCHRKNPMHTKTKKALTSDINSTKEVYLTKVQKLRRVCIPINTYAAMNLNQNERVRVTITKIT